MALLNLTLLFLAVISCGIATETTGSPENTTPDSYKPLRPSQQYELPATDLQLPKMESTNLPFYAPDLMTVLKPPQYNSEPDYYQVPIPAQDLIAPIETEWNPNNDPQYYYTLPSKHYQLPTNEFPKKFSQTLHFKDKPISNKPKIEIELDEINEEQYKQKQKELTKNYDNLAKKENQKEILKRQQTIQI